MENNNAQLVSHNTDLHPRSIHLDLPIFHGDNPHGWLFKVNHFFTYHNIPTQNRLRLVSLHMEGKVLVWFQDLEQSGRISTWDAFVNALIIRFGPTTYDDPMEQVAKLTQKGSVEYYKAEFEALSNRLPSLSESYKLSCFLSDLRDDIRLTVKMFTPNDLLMAYGLAKIQEEKNYLYKKTPYRNPSYNTTFQTSELAYIKSHPPLSTTNPLPNQPKAIVPMHKVSQQEMRERRAKGLCYSCDSKWAPGHKCSNPKLYLIEEIEENYEVVGY